MNARGCLRRYSSAIRFGRTNGIEAPGDLVRDAVGDGQRALDHPRDLDALLDVLPVARLGAAPVLLVVVGVDRRDVLGGVRRRLEVGVLRRAPSRPCGVKRRTWSRLSCDELAVLVGEGAVHRLRDPQAGETRAVLVHGDLAVLELGVDHVAELDRLGGTSTRCPCRGRAGRACRTSSPSAFRRPGRSGCSAARSASRTGSSWRTPRRRRAGSGRRSRTRSCGSRRRASR